MLHLLLLFSNLVNQYLSIQIDATLKNSRNITMIKFNYKIINKRISAMKRKKKGRRKKTWRKKYLEMGERMWV